MPRQKKPRGRPPKYPMPDPITRYTRERSPVHAAAPFTPRRRLGVSTGTQASAGQRSGQNAKAQAVNEPPVWFISGGQLFEPCLRPDITPIPNDYCKATFPQIADHVEKYQELLFVNNGT